MLSHDHPGVNRYTHAHEQFAALLGVFQSVSGGIATLEGQQRSPEARLDLPGQRGVVVE